jgi:hypothetical protein
MVAVAEQLPRSARCVGKCWSFLIYIDYTRAGLLGFFTGFAALARTGVNEHLVLPGMFACILLN